jgi:hypothetical protein
MTEEALSQSLSSTVYGIQNEILLAAIAIVIVLAMVAIAGRFTILNSIIIVVIFVIALLAYNQQKRNVTIRPPGSITSTTDAERNTVGWSLPAELLLPDPMVLLNFKPQLKTINFDWSFKITTKKSTWIYIAVLSNFQSLVFIPDVPIRIWRLRTLRHEHVPISLNDIRTVKTSDSEAPEELQFHVLYRLLFAFKDSAIRSQLALSYQIWASDDDRKNWWSVSGPRVVYAKFVREKETIRKLLGDASSKSSTTNQSDSSSDKDASRAG